ncbi:unnamed protein product [Rotaria sp. Silwood2]|nr:unnamed protein product [Rotaria sp. Silwood2]CAF2525802.1 unnamed protein product [Rotaria sp. Silwood2]CAF3882901.1 unnamed protein product [Rotaria sp. Silwood2]CAF3924122.1 unnamed protein product [Rotaria sp. Silwood2]
MDSESKYTIKNDSTLIRKLIVLLQRLLYDIWSSPINLVLAILIICLLVKLFLLKRKSSNNASRKQTPVQLPKMSQCDLTVSELRGYNGIESNGRILTVVYGDIFDVSQRSDLYGIGGSYSLFAGRDATRALSKMQLDPSLFSNEYDDLSDITDKERATARSWHEDFREKYDLVGHLLKPGEKPCVYPPDDTTVDGAYNINDTRNRLFDEIDENERCDIIISNILFDDLFASNDALCITHLDSVSVQSSKVAHKKTSSNSERQNNRGLGSTNSSRNSKRNRNNSLEEYPLHLACQNGQIEVVGKLLQEFSPVTLEHDMNRWSPIHHAAWHGHHRIVELLLRSKRFSVNAVDNSHMSPLHLAAVGGRAEVARILLDCPDINVHAKNKDGKTALDFCKQNPNRDWQICTELIEKFLQKPVEKIKICLADGSTIELDLVSGPAETTVRQLHAQMMIRLRLPDEVSHVFGIWICSKSVRIQLNPDHKPVQFLLNWKRYASELTTIPNESSLRNPSFSSSPTLNTNSEDAQLWWSRDTLLKIEFEQRLRIPHVIHLLFLEAYQNYLLANYPCTDEDAIEFAVLMMGINEKQLDDKLWEHFFHNDPNNLTLLIPAEKLKRAGVAYWRRTILKRYKEVFIDDQTMQNRPQLSLYLKMQFLNLAQNLTSYGSSFFTGEHEYHGRRTSVFICVNDVGVHLINRATKSQEYSFSYQQMTFTIETEAQSTLEINVKDNKNVDHTRLLNSTNNKNFKNSIFPFSSSNKQSNKIDRPLTSSSTSLSSTLTNSLNNNNEFQQRNHNRHILYTKQNFLIYHLMSNFAQEHGSFI